MCDVYCMCVCVDDDELAFWSVFLMCFWLDDSQGLCVLNPQCKNTTVECLIVF